MGKTILQNQTAEVLTFDMVQSSDSKTPATGLTPTVVISKNGGSYLAPSGAVSEVGNGTYKIVGNATDANTLGILKIYATASGADAAKEEYAVVAYDSRDAIRLGLTAIPNVAQGNSGALPVGDSNGRVLLQVLQTGVVIPTVTAITTAVDISQSAADKVWNTGTRSLTTFGTLAADIWANATRRLTNLDDTRAAKIDNLDAPVSSRSYHSALDVWLVSLNASFTANSLGQWFARIINNALGTDYRMKVSTDVHSSGVTVADVTNKSGFAPNAAQNAAAVRTELEPELAHIDEDISSRSTPDDLNVTVEPTPVTVNPTPVTVNPTPVTVNPTPVTVEPTLTTEQAAQLEAASTVGALIEDGVFSEAALVNAGGEASLSAEDSANLAAAKQAALGAQENTARLALVPGTPETPVFVIPALDTPGLVNVLCRAGDFGTPRNGTSFTFRLTGKQAFIGEEFQVARQREKKTISGECLVPIYPSSTLSTKGLNPATYDVLVNKTKVGSVTVPDSGGILKMVNGALIVEAAI